MEKPTLICVHVGRGPLSRGLCKHESRVTCLSHVLQNLRTYLSLGLNLSSRTVRDCKQGKTECFEIVSEFQHMESLVLMTF